MSAPASNPRRVARVLTGDDLDRVVAIDQMHSGHARRHFFEKRFEAARTRPADYLQVGVTVDGQLHGFATARILRGEYGHKDALAILDALGVDPKSREQGIGQSLMRELIELSRKHGLRLLQSQANWTNHELLRFFDASHFALAARITLERSVAELRAEDDEEV